MSPHSLQMSEREIEKSYREALHQPTQIKILAQLNACKEQVIIDILIRNGHNIPTKKRMKANRKPRKTDWTVDELITLLDLRSQGKSFEEISLIIKRSTYGCKAAYTRMNHEERDSMCNARRIFEERNKPSL